jgi:hypothetical protein
MQQAAAQVPLCWSAAAASPRPCKAEGGRPGRRAAHFVGVAAAQFCTPRKVKGSSAPAQGAHLDDAPLGVAAAQRVVERQRATRDGSPASATRACSAPAPHSLSRSTAARARTLS